MYDRLVAWAIRKEKRELKYNILGFKQEKLIENNLSTEDALILRTIKDMYSSSGMEFITENNVRYMWMNYTYLLRQLPIVGSKRNLMRRIEFYGKELFLLRVLKKEKRGIKGNFSYISPTEKLDSLQDLDLMTKSHKVMTKSHKPYDKIAQALTTESHNKDSSNKNDSSINDSINTLSCKQDRTDNITKEVIDLLNDVAGTNYKASTSKTKTLIQARLKEGFSLEDFNRVIDKKCREWSNTEMAKYLRPETLFGTKFESYLNQPDAIAVQKDDYFAHGRLV